MKRTIASLLALCMLLALVACAKTNEPEPVKEPEAATTAAPEPEPTAVP